MTAKLTLFIVFLALSTGIARANTPKVDDFVLIDHTGKAQQLYYDQSAQAIVLISQSNGCAAVQSSVADVKALRDDYASQGVKVLMVNSNPLDKRAAIIDEAKQWNIDIPILDDSSGIIGQSLTLNNASEVLVISSDKHELLYRGPLNNNPAEGAQADRQYVRETLDPLLSGEPVSFSSVPTDGCAIELAAAPQTISYAKDIAPILQKNCVACHVEGGIGPWAMSEYRMVQGFAPMMREVIRVKRMPPWHADPEVGQWQHDGGLSDADTRTLISWIEDGAPRGEGDDPLLAAKPTVAEWPLGEPDLILELPAFDVPANGVVEYQFPVVENPLDRDAWVMAATVVPGDAKVVHHVLMGSASKAPDKDDREGVFENYIMGYAPGNESAYMPEGTGVMVPQGGVYLLQIHYTPVGKASTDRTRVGLYFADQPPANFLRQQVVLNPKIQIEPNSAEHEEHAYFEFYDDAIIYSLVPHAHYRGRSSTFDLTYPNGDTERILSVPNYDFNWQRTYEFEQPKSVPAGTKIVHRTVYDNSTNNAGNPDPDRIVPWGLQSHDEMLYGSVSFAWTAERSDAPIHDKTRFETAQWMGFMDQDMNGKVSKDEMPEKLRESIGWKWLFLDRDFNGGLDLAEMTRLVENIMSDKGP